MYGFHYLRVKISICGKSVEHSERSLEALKVLLIHKEKKRYKRYWIHVLRVKFSICGQLAKLLERASKLS